MQQNLFSDDAPATTSHFFLGSNSKKMPATSGKKCLEQLHRFSRVGEWAKSFADILVSESWYSARCKLSWKLRGSKYNRIYLHLTVRALGTKENEFVLLPTPTVSDTEGGKQMPKIRNGRYYRTNKKGVEWGVKLRDVVESGMLIPTPTASDYKGARTSESLKAAGRSETNSLPDFFNQSGKSTFLNPAFVAEMMGFPADWVTLPFQDQIFKK